MTEPIQARISITPAEWAAFRKACIDEEMRPSVLLAALVLNYLKGRK